MALSQESTEKLNSLDVKVSEAVQLTEHQRVIEDTKDLPQTPNYIYDQTTYDYFRKGIAFREAIEASFSEGRFEPDSTDMQTAFENINSNVNRGVVNQGLLDARLAEVSSAFGEDFDIEKEVTGDLKFESAGEVAAVLAGLFSAGDMLITRQRKDILEGRGPEKPSGDLHEIINNLEEVYNPHLLAVVIKMIPRVGGLNKAVEEFVASKAGDEFKNPFDDFGTTRSSMYFDNIREERSENQVAKAEDAVAEAFGAPAGEASNLPPPAPKAQIEAAAPVSLDEEVQSAVERVLCDQIAEVQAGEGQTIEIELPKVEEIPTAEPEDIELPQEPEKTPEDIMREACATPQTLIEAMSNPETPQELKRAVQELVKASREATAADATVDAWENEVKPLIQKIGGEKAQDVENSLRNVLDSVLEQKNIMVNVSRNLEAASHERTDDRMQDLLRNVTSSTDTMSTELRSGRFKEAVVGSLDDQRVVSMRTMMAEEDLRRVNKKLEANLYSPATPEEIQRLYESNGAVLRQGIDGVRQAAQQLTTQTEEKSPNWRMRRSKIQDLFGRVAVVARSSVVGNRSTSEVALINDLELANDAARKVANLINEHGMMPQKSIAALGDKLDQITRQYDQLFGQLEGLMLLAGSVRSLVADIR